MCLQLDDPKSDCIFFLNVFMVGVGVLVECQLATHPSIFLTGTIFHKNWQFGPILAGPCKYQIQNMYP